ncbi:MAG: phosphocholine cytidylyltransferase family protein [Bacteroidota bacterium]|mgnify:CR=1 FL=1
MKCVILAAGISSRLLPLTASTPKCLLEVGKYAILERTLRNVLLYDLSDFVIVTGPQAEMITDFIEKTFPSLNAEFVYNERFADTNNSYSLALAQEAVHGDSMLLMDSDIVFDHRILSEVLQSPHENCLVVRREGNFDEEEVSVAVDERGRIIRIGKEFEEEPFLGESIGIEKFSRSGTAKLFEILQHRVFDEGRENEFYEASFQELIDLGVSIYAVDAKGFPCIEIDTLEDLQKANHQIAPQLDGI